MARYKLFAGGVGVLAALWLVALVVDKPTSAAPSPEPEPVSVWQVADVGCLGPTSLMYVPTDSHSRWDVIYAACAGRVWRIEVPR